MQPLSRARSQNALTGFALLQNNCKKRIKIFRALYIPDSVCYYKNIAKSSF